MPKAVSLGGRWCVFVLFSLLPAVRKGSNSCPKEGLVKLKTSVWSLCQSAVQGCTQGMVAWVHLGWEIEGEETAVMRADLAPVRSGASSAWVWKSPRTVSLVWTPSSCQTASLHFIKKAVCLDISALAEHFSYPSHFLYWINEASQRILLQQSWS